MSSKSKFHHARICAEYYTAWKTRVEPLGLSQMQLSRALGRLVESLSKKDLVQLLTQELEHTKK